MAHDQRIRAHDLEVGDRVEATPDGSGVIGYVDSIHEAGIQVRLDATNETSLFAAHCLHRLPSQSEIARQVAQLQKRWNKRQEMDHRVIKQQEAELPIWKDFAPEEPKEWTL